ncbi:MAG: ribosome assembly cofactor RimP [Bacteroidetes bacterium]|nr:ribosome assembly cofactor RimP [Bacteroidota bacterium]
MITVQSITQLVEEKLKGTDRFIISVKVSPNKRIEVLLDGLSNIAISDCIDMSRHIESSLDREQEDFELMVSSAGIDEAFVVEKQYQKNIGREVDVVKKDGNKINGKLISYKEADAIVVESSKTVKDEKKKKQIITEQITIPLQEIKETKLVLSFK